MVAPILILIILIVVGIALGIILGEVEMPVLETIGNLLASVIGYLFVPVYFIATTIMYDRLIASRKLTN